jgi:hypothetical protein
VIYCVSSLFVFHSVVMTIVLECSDDLFESVVMTVVSECSDDCCLRV